MGVGGYPSIQRVRCRNTPWVGRTRRNLESPIILMGMSENVHIRMIGVPGKMGKTCKFQIESFSSETKYALDRSCELFTFT